MAQALILDPEDIKAHPEVAETVVALLRHAAEAGEVVRIETSAKMLTPAEVADRLNMSRPTISRRIAAGDLHTIKVGNRHRVPLPEFERFRNALMGAMVAQTSDDIEADLYDA